MQQLPFSIDGPTQVWSYSFNGQTPGPFLCVNEGDHVTITLTNTSNAVGEFEYSAFDIAKLRAIGTKNWDPETVRANSSGIGNLGMMFRNANLPLGGAQSLSTNIGDSKTITFIADRPGVWMYNAMVVDPDNGAVDFSDTMYATLSGLSGAMMVNPRGGRRAFGHPIQTVDKMFVLGEQEFYVPHTTNPDLKRVWDSTYTDIDALKDDTLALMLAGPPTHLCFNAHVPRYNPERKKNEVRRGFFTAGVEDTLQFEHGDNIAMINLVASRFSSPHLIGGHADLCWLGGSFSNHPVLDQESWYTCNGTATFATYTVSQPGQYVIVNHNLNEAFLLGAFGAAFSDTGLTYVTSTDSYILEPDKKNWDLSLMARVDHYLTIADGTQVRPSPNENTRDLPGFIKTWSV
jgi:nitrite reductase (NO-forming)